MSSEKSHTKQDENPVVNKLLDRLSTDRFHNWYREQQYRQNIENGTPFFNGPSKPPDPERHSPSSLLRCHRKRVYRAFNAPEEQSRPNGIFWVGSKIEERVILPFLREKVATADTYVQNSIWVDYHVETDVGRLQFKGETDPLIVDANGVPLLPTEIKTKAAVDSISSPSGSHRAQLHAYMLGLSEKFDIKIREGVILYCSRKSFDVRVFHIEFDEEFWDSTVLEWAIAQTQYRLRDELPPAIPESEWECRYCSYRRRCGKGDDLISDENVSGLLPLMDDYPEERLREYFDAYPDAQITPTLAHQYPGLAIEKGTYEWECTACRSKFPVETVPWDGDLDCLPACERCAANQVYAPLVDPDPNTQRRRMGVE